MNVIQISTNPITPQYNKLFINILVFAPHSIRGKSNNQCMWSQRKWTVAFPISNVLHAVTSMSSPLLFLQMSNNISVPFFKWEVCLLHSEQMTTEMGKAVSPHFNVFFWKPIRLNIPAGIVPSNSADWCDLIKWANIYCTTVQPANSRIYAMYCNSSTEFGCNISTLISKVANLPTRIIYVLYHRLKAGWVLSFSSWWHSHFPPLQTIPESHFSLTHLTTNAFWVIFCLHEKGPSNVSYSRNGCKWLKSSITGPYMAVWQNDIVPFCVCIIHFF